MPETTIATPPQTYIPPSQAQALARSGGAGAIEGIDTGPAGLVRPGFDTVAGFQLLQRQAALFSSSEIVPEAFRGHIADCAIVCEAAARAGISPLFVFQNLYVVKGKPKWSGKACIAIINRSGLFEPLDFEWGGARGTDSWSCTAIARRRSDGKFLRGTTVSIAIVKAEGWWSNVDRNGVERSKWQTIPEQMFRYRAASMWLDAFYPEGLSGLPVENGLDAAAIEVPATAVSVPEPAKPEEKGDPRKEDAHENAGGSAAQRSEPAPADTASPPTSGDKRASAAPSAPPPGFKDLPGEQAASAPATPPAEPPKKKRGAAAVTEAVKRIREGAERAAPPATPPPASTQAPAPAPAQPESKAPAADKFCLGCAGNGKPGGCKQCGKASAEPRKCELCAGEGGPDGCPKCGVVSDPPAPAAPAPSNAQGAPAPTAAETGERRAPATEDPKQVGHREMSMEELVAYVKANADDVTASGMVRKFQVSFNRVKAAFASAGVPLR